MPFTAKEHEARPLLGLLPTAGVAAAKSSRWAQSGIGFFSERRGEAERFKAPLCAELTVVSENAAAKAKPN